VSWQQNVFKTLLENAKDGDATSVDKLRELCGALVLKAPLDELVAIGDAIYPIAWAAPPNRAA
jgi:hypothetical protein